MLIHLAAAAIAKGNPPVIALSGETISAVDGVSPYNTSIAIKFRSNGTVEKASRINGEALSYSQIDGATDWITPNHFADSTYDVRFTNYVDGGSADTFTTLAATLNTWIDLGSDRVWLFNDTTINAGNGFTVDFEIRDDAGTTLASTTYTFTLENTA